MPIPGFSAEASLQRTLRQYRSRAPTHAGGGSPAAAVVPAADCTGAGYAAVGFMYLAMEAYASGNPEAGSFYAEEGAAYSALFQACVALSHTL